MAGATWAESDGHGGLGLGGYVMNRFLLGSVALIVAAVGFSKQYLVKKPAKKKVRVYMDGCFDMMHYGHANALRQARSLGDELVVGLVSDEEIILNKGPPVTKMDERKVMVEATKWVDEVIVDAPYAITEEFMQKLFTEYGIDYIIHGDDPCLLPDGTDAYAAVRKAGRFKQVKRTEGVSSTDIVGTAHRGPHHPIMNVHERSLSVLSCRYVDEVIIGAPWEVTKDLITTFNISLVVRGTVAETCSFVNGEIDPYTVPRDMGVLEVIESPRDITTSTIIKRIVLNHEAYQKRNEKKTKGEEKYYSEKSFVVDA
ncbi:hypothetical protein CBR_g19052 [Chara braunii]|uniref:ethanolamine-phosphate cytidylyltransferase n=1 Tax=Chara braunii TaxID=69332 RepID=A0A388KX70_CHABU|nr:hypothetical protein CBR_g19052 [Chara braunii]|eukprot:GBG74645.1 hypothetical protein CBR_g19052 [Chara braunii]